MGGGGIGGEKGDLRKQGDVRKQSDFLFFLISFFRKKISFVRGILQARMLEWVAIPFSRGSFRPRDGTPEGEPRVSCTADGFFTI